MDLLVVAVVLRTLSEALPLKKYKGGITGEAVGVRLTGSAGRMTGGAIEGGVVEEVEWALLDAGILVEVLLGGGGLAAETLRLQRSAAGLATRIAGEAVVREIRVEPRIAGELARPGLVVPRIGCSLSAGQAIRGELVGATLAGRVTRQAIVRHRVREVVKRTSEEALSGEQVGFGGLAGLAFRVGGPTAAEALSIALEAVVSGVREVRARAVEETLLSELELGIHRLGAGLALRVGGPAAGETL